MFLVGTVCVAQRWCLNDSKNKWNVEISINIIIIHTVYQDSTKRKPLNIAKAISKISTSHH